MLRYDRQIKPGLVVLYDVEPGNGAVLFLQPGRPHGAINFGESPLSARRGGGRMAHCGQKWKGQGVDFYSIFTDVIYG